MFHTPVPSASHGDDDDHHLGSVMRVARRFDDIQQRHLALGFPVAVLYKFVNDQGVYLAVLIAYYGLVGVFPLLLLLSTVLGFVLAGESGLQQYIMNSALSRFPVIGDELDGPQRVGGGVTGVVVGVLGALYGGLGVTVAYQNAMNTAWSVPRHLRPGPIRARARGLLLLGALGFGILGASAISGIGALAHLAGPLTWLLFTASLVLNCTVFIVAFRLTTVRAVSTRDVAPGAIAAAVSWQLLQTFGAFFVGKVAHSSSATNGVFALVLGLLAFLFLAATAVVVCAEINVVRVDKLYPRTLLAPVTDDTELSAG
jgi:membrane protein